MSTETELDERTKLETEAAAFRRLVQHFRDRPEVQNVDMMITADFCRNCLSDWYREAAAERGVTLSKDGAREIVYGMPYADWKSQHQQQMTPEQQAAFDARMAKKKNA